VIRQELLGCPAVERGKPHASSRVVTEDEPHGPVAEAANPIEEEDRYVVDSSWPGILGDSGIGAMPWRRGRCGHEPNIPSGLGFDNGETFDGAPAMVE
jgi:hypothetical protein